MNLWKKIAVASVALVLMGAQYTRLNPVRVSDNADGTANHVFGWDGSGVAESQSRDGARVFNNANISISNSVTTALTFNTETFDDNDLHSTVSNTGRLTAQVAGRYLIVGNITFAVASGGNRNVSIRINGSTVVGIQSEIAVTTGRPQMIVVAIYNLAADDYAELTVFQDSGGSLNTEVFSSHSPRFMMQRLRSQ